MQLKLHPTNHFHRRKNTFIDEKTLKVGESEMKSRIPRAFEILKNSEDSPFRRLRNWKCEADSTDMIVGLIPVFRISGSSSDRQLIFFFENQPFSASDSAFGLCLTAPPFPFADILEGGTLAVEKKGEKLKWGHCSIVESIGGLI